MTVIYAPGIAEFVAQFQSHKPEDSYAYPLVRQRQMYREALAACRDVWPPAITARDDALAADGREVPVRLYRDGATGAAPCILYAHGGGYVLGGLDTHHGFCAELADRTGACVIAVDYRLAPDDPFPAANQDMSAALAAITAMPERFAIDAERIVVAGDSAGGGLAAVAALIARDHGGPSLAGQMLINPMLDLVRWTNLDLTSDSPHIDREMQFYATSYLGWSALPDDPEASPLMAEDLSGLPPAVIVAMEHDVLRQDAEAYAQRLREAGGIAELVVAPGLIHGGLRARHVSPAAGQAFEQVCAAARRLLSGVAAASR